MKMELSLPRELEKAKRERYPLCIPVGVMEYHAAHCALGCDTIIPFRLLERYEKKRPLVLAPPIWYGPASYSVAGCEKNSIDVSDTVFEEYMYNILKPLIKGGWRNIYMILIHQTATQNATELSCIKASKRVLFEYMQERFGDGWWGSNSNADFYETMTEADNPWSYMTVMPVMERRADKKMPLDHAGVNETSLLWACMPEAVDMNRTSENTEWFAASAVDASKERGEELITEIFEYWDRVIR